MNRSHTAGLFAFAPQAIILQELFMWGDLTFICAGQ